jgi:hypothetical protein
VERPLWRGRTGPTREPAGCAQADEQGSRTLSSAACPAPTRRRQPAREDRDGLTATGDAGRHRAGSSGPTGGRRSAYSKGPANAAGGSPDTRVALRAPGSRGPFTSRGARARQGAQHAAAARSQPPATSSAPLSLVAARGGAGDDLRLLGADVRHRPDVLQRPAHPAPDRRRHRGGALHGRGDRERPGGVPEARAHGARHALGPRRLPGTRLHGRVPASRGRHRARSRGDGPPRQALRAALPGGAGGRGRRGAGRAQGRPLRSGHGHAAILAGRGRGEPRTRELLGGVLLQGELRSRAAARNHRRSCTCSSRSSGSRPPGSPAASSWRLSSAARSLPDRSSSSTFSSSPWWWWWAGASSASS